MSGTTEPTKEPVKEPTKEPVKEPTKEPVKEPTKEPVKEPTKEPVKEPTKEPVKEPTKEPEKGEEDKELDTSVWGYAGDEIANSVLTTLQNSGVTTDEAKALLWDAVEAGDPTKVDRDKLVEKVGASNATLIMAGIENVTSKNNAKIEEVTEIANTAAGGADNWKAVRDWAKQNIAESELAELAGMLDQGGSQAKFAAKEIVDKYNADTKNTSVGDTTPLKGDGKDTSPVGEGISKREYGTQLMVLRRRGGTDADYKALKAKRDLGKRQGK